MEDSIETELLDQLLDHKRAFQTYAVKVLYDHAEVVSSLKLSEIAPSPAVLQQFEKSFDAIEEILAKGEGLLIDPEPISDFGRRFKAIGYRRQEDVRRTYLSILGTFGIKDDDTPLTAVQRRQLKALLRRGLEGGFWPEVVSDKEFVKEILSKLITSR